jgi:hypothetical protein
MVITRGDPSGVARAEEQLALSERLLREARTTAIDPLKELRSRNNVTALVQGMAKKRGKGGS